MRHLLILVALFPAFSHAQIVWTDPAFPAQDEPFTLYYDASQGNGEVDGVIPLYGHFGVITNNSETPTDWLHVIGDWGTADADVLMSYEGGSIYSFDYSGQTLEAFHSLDVGETVSRLAMVFRNAGGTNVGREADGSDIFFDMPESSFELQVLTPQPGSCTVLNVGDSQMFDVLVSESSSLSLQINGEEVASAEGTSIQHTETFETGGEFTVTIEATNDTETISESVTLIVLSETVVENPPAGVRDGINYIDDNTVILQLYAPFKEYVFAVGDFSDWNLGIDYLMKQVPGGQKWWVELSGLTPGQDYRYQYWIDDECLKVADAYSEVVLDPWNDPWIDETTYPNLPEYPQEGSNEPVSVFKTGEPEFNWTDGDYERPAQENLVIYELLLRDFIEAHDYSTLEDTLSYLKNLGITALELMPFNEFNGNNSWGYNPTFYFAPDKYYGNKESLQSLINACHEEGIAVIMDVALNHADLPNPQLKMYWDANEGDWGAPATNNPWFNQYAPHALSFFFDYDHSSIATKDFVKRFMEHWNEEYHIDGWRWDFTQGFTQTEGNAGGYDQFRIDVLTEYANHIWDTDPTAYMILEHWCDYSEEQALSANGMMVWANVTHNYQEGAMGYPSNFSWANYQDHGFSEPHVVSYAESHDEERLMYKNLEFGNGAAEYQVTNWSTALQRMELSACFNIPIPGPKLIWQFGELGYDYSINTCEDGVTVDEGCRVAPKPIRWDYRDVPARYRIYQVMAALNKLKRDYPTFQTTNFNLDVDGTGKRIHLYHDDMDVVIVGNFDIVDFNMVPGFPHTGTWYDYFTGEAFEVTDLGASIHYDPGEYHLYTDQPLPTPELNTGVEDLELASLAFTAYPNPTESDLTLEFTLARATQAHVRVMDLQGRHIGTLDLGTLAAGQNRIEWNGHFAEGNHWGHGVYQMQLVTEYGTTSQTIVRQ